jgi:hypothetical protein
MSNKITQRPKSRNKTKLSQRRAGKLRTLRFPLIGPVRDLRRAKCRVTLQEAASLAIEAGYTRDRLIDELDDLLVVTVMDAFPDNVHLAALVLEVPDRFVSIRWHGLEKTTAEK